MKFPALHALAQNLLDPVIAPMLPILGIDVVAFGVILMMLIETALLPRRWD